MFKVDDIMLKQKYVKDLFQHYTSTTQVEHTYQQIQAIFITNFIKNHQIIHNNLLRVGHGEQEEKRKIKKEEEEEEGN